MSNWETSIKEYDDIKVKITNLCLKNKTTHFLERISPCVKFTAVFAAAVLAFVYSRSTESMCYNAEKPINITLDSFNNLFSGTMVNITSITDKFVLFTAQTSQPCYDTSISPQYVAVPLFVIAAILFLVDVNTNIHHIMYVIYLMGGVNIELPSDQLISKIFYRSN